MAIKMYSELPELHHQLQFSIIPWRPLLLRSRSFEEGTIRAASTIWWWLSAYSKSHWKGDTHSHIILLHTSSRSSLFWKLRNWVCLLLHEDDLTHIIYVIFWRHRLLLFTETVYWNLLICLRIVVCVDPVLLNLLSNLFFISLHFFPWSHQIFIETCSSVFILSVCKRKTRLLNYFHFLAFLSLGSSNIYWNMFLRIHIKCL